MSAQRFPFEIEIDALRRRNGALVSFIQSFGEEARRAAKDQGLIPPPNGATLHSRVAKLVEVSINTASELPPEHALSKAAREVVSYFELGAEAARHRSTVLSPNAAQGRKGKAAKRRSA